MNRVAITGLGVVSPLGNGEPVSWTFQPYPGGTGALMEKLVRERGAAAFRRSSFTVPKWTGSVPNAPDDIAFLPAHRISALIRERKLSFITHRAQIFDKAPDQPQRNHKLSQSQH